MIKCMVIIVPSVGLLLLLVLLGGRNYYELRIGSPPVADVPRPYPLRKWTLSHENISPGRRRGLSMCFEGTLFAKKNMDHDIQKENLLMLKEFLEELHVEYYLDAGTLLGAVRDKGFITGDTDADLMITLDGADTIRRHRDKLEDMGFVMWRDRTCKELSIRVFLLNPQRRVHRLL